MIDAGQPHTPGPWQWRGYTLEPVTKDPATSAVHSILDAEGGYGFLGSNSSDTNAELAADHRLIAAAPDLLTALQALARRFRTCCPAETPHDDALLLAERAIAHATGRAE